MTTFMKTKFNISDDQTNIDKYRLAANTTEYHIIFCGSEIHLKHSNLSIHKKLDFCGPVSNLR